MRVTGLALVTLVLAALGCSSFKDGAAPVESEAGADAGIAVDKGASTPSDAAIDDASPALVDASGHPDAGVQVTVEQLVTARSRLGARSPAGFRPWRSGIAVADSEVFWVESGTQPGLYAAPTTACTTATCVRKVATFTRPSSFYATSAAMYVADTTVLKRIPYQASAATTVASATDEIVNLTSDGTSVFWTSGTDQSIRKTANGTTSSLIHSNGTPVAMALAGTQVFWVGVDISGQSGAMQAIGADGKGAREVSRFSAGFDTMRGNATYLYYAKDSPATVHRRTLSTGHDEVVDKDVLTVTDIAVDDTYAYWTEAGDGPDHLNGRVRRVAHDSQIAETLAVSVAYPIALAVSGGSVYVASAGTRASAYADGVILRLTVAK